MPYFNVTHYNVKDTLKDLNPILWSIAVCAAKHVKKQWNLNSNTTWTECQTLVQLTVAAIKSTIEGKDYQEYMSITYAESALWYVLYVPEGE